MSTNVMGGFARKAFDRRVYVPTSNMGVADGSYLKPLPFIKYIMPMNKNTLKQRPATDYTDIQYQIKNQPLTRTDFPQDFSTVWSF